MWFFVCLFVCFVIFRGGDWDWNFSLSKKKSLDLYYWTLDSPWKLAFFAYLTVFLNEFNLKCYGKQMLIYKLVLVIVILVTANFVWIQKILGFFNTSLCCQKLKKMWELHFLIQIYNECDFWAQPTVPGMFFLTWMQMQRKDISMLQNLFNCAVLPNYQLEWLVFII